MIDVSIIIPNFNNEKFVEHAVKSALQQSHDNIEVIVVDDASTDNSLRKLDRFSEDKRLRILKNNKNIGVSRTRNRGILESVGKYITFLDSDDYYHKKKIENEFNLITAHPDCFAYSNINIVDKDGEALFLQKLPDKCTFFRNLFRFGQVPRDMLVPRLLLIEEEIFFDETLSLYEDWKWKLKLNRRLNGLNTFKEGTNYRKLSNGLSSKPKIIHLYTLIKVFWQSLRDFNIFVRLILCPVFALRLAYSYLNSLIR